MKSHVRVRFVAGLAALVLALGALVAAPVVLGAATASADTGVHSVSDGCGTGYYENANGRCIPTPDGSVSSIRCKDGSYSHAENRRGACSNHGGIAGGSDGGDPGLALGVLGVGSAVVGVAALLPLLLGGLIFGS